VVRTDVSEQPIFPIFKGQSVEEECSTLEDGTDIVPKRRLETTILLCVTSRKNANLE